MTISRLRRDLDDIVDVSRSECAFWSAAQGWASPEVAELLSQSRLDFVASLSETLRLRVDEVLQHPNEAGSLIIAWVHMRALIEAHLLLFLTVYLKDYKKQYAKNSANMAPPDKLEKLPFEALRKFFFDNELLPRHRMHDYLIRRAIIRGNSIHSFSNREIGTSEEYLESISDYREFLFDLTALLPKP